MKAAEIRQKFIDYFKNQGHTHVESSRLIPEGDPTLLFTNSGMVQFKNVFLGYDKRPYARATTAQKCVRAGGKHNDLDNVGHTARHHTFFEMMGNFSFGDYFKKEAIHFAWDLLINHLHFPKEKLSVTVFRDDDEAFEIWNKQEKVPAEKISRFGEKDNFWQMADTGPCGPCSEIFYDHGPQPNCPDPKNCKVGCECDRFVEIWNLVFMQFNKDEAGVLHPLPKPSVDTGAGLERLAAALQGVASNYDTDAFTGALNVLENKTGKNYRKLAADPKTSNLAAAMRVMADHSRTAAFLIAEGVLPSNEGQGYVLRRIMRRGLRYGRKLSNESLMESVVAHIVEQYGEFYKELKQRKDFILQAVTAEEERFLSALDTGTELFNKAVQVASNIKTGKILSGDLAFKLYDTYGFPLDLTQLMAQERGLTVDEAEFEGLMQKQRETAKASGKWSSREGVDLGQLMKSLQGHSPTRFLGYEQTQTAAQVEVLFFHGEKVKTLTAPQEGLIITDSTVFYAEGGGQVGDKGQGKKNQTAFEVLDTKKINDVFVHFVQITSGSLSVGDQVSLEVSPQRIATQANHSATHLLHAALRKTLGDHVAQAGSLVDAQKLRFDFNNPKPLTTEQIKKVEELVNEQISFARPVQAKVQSYKDAVASGALALFGEKYSDQVRVLKMGDFSTELCGGTHVRNTSEIRLFKILKEAGVSSGVRRIEAITGTAAIDYVLSRESELTQIETELKTINAGPGKVFERVCKLQEQIKKLEKDLKQKALQGPGVNVDELIGAAKTVKGVQVISHHVEISDREMLSQLSDKVKDKLRSGIVVLVGSPSEESPSCPIVVTVTKDLSEKFHAGNILKQVAAVMGGKGGGRPDFAQGSGPEASKANEAAQKALEIL